MPIWLIILLVMTALGLIFGFILAYANKKLSVEVNPLIHIVEDILPKGQCGACGYAGCRAYAEAVVLNPDVEPNLCVPGKTAVAKAVAEITGKKAKMIEPRIAHICCSGTIGKAVKAYDYDGVEDCFAATLLQGGPKYCKYGCLGLGTCVKNCPFGAMSIGENGLPVVDTAKCTGCGMCESVCPRGVITMIPVNAVVRVDCNSNEKGAAARKACGAACIGCSLCMKNCPHGAIVMDNNLPVINYSICAEICTERLCVSKCPTKVLHYIFDDGVGKVIVHDNMKPTGTEG